MLKSIYALMTRNPDSAAEDYIGFTALFVIVVVGLNLPAVL